MENKILSYEEYFGIKKEEPTITESKKEPSVTLKEKMSKISKQIHGGIVSVDRTQEELDRMKEFQPELYYAIDNYN